jgi:hypothetical protein
MKLKRKLIILGACALLFVLSPFAQAANDYFDGDAHHLTPATRARSSDLNAAWDALEDGFDRLPSETNLKRGIINYVATDSGAADAYVVSLPYAPTSYVDGMEVLFKVANSNTGASTINVNSLGLKSIKRQDGTELNAGDLAATYIIILRYNATTGFFHINGGTVGTSGAGTMASQNANSVSITGGTIAASTLSGTLQFSSILDPVLDGSVTNRCFR